MSFQSWPYKTLMHLLMSPTLQVRHLFWSGFNLVSKSSFCCDHWNTLCFHSYCFYHKEYWHLMVVLYFREVIVLIYLYFKLNYLSGHTLFWTNKEIEFFCIVLHNKKTINQVFMTFPEICPCLLQIGASWNSSQCCLKAQLTKASCFY